MNLKEYIIVFWKELVLHTQQGTQQKAVITQTLCVVSSIYRRLSTYTENYFLSDETLASQMPPTYCCIKVTGMKLDLQSKEVICCHISISSTRGFLVHGIAPRVVTVTRNSSCK